MEFSDSILRPPLSGAEIRSVSDTAAESATVRYAQNALVGVVLPVLFALVNQHIAGLSTGQIAVVLLAEIGAYGFLCARFVQPRTLKWAAYAWMLATLDLTLFPLLAYGDWWRNSRSLLLPALWSAQLDLIVLWAVFGHARWAVRVPIAFTVLSLGIFVPPVAVPQGPRFLALIIATQTLALLAICIGLQRLRYGVSPGPKPSISSAQRGRVQFGLKDLLLWTTLAAMLLGLARAFGFLSLSSFLGFFGNGRGVLLLAAATGGSTALVLIATLNGVLGESRVWTRLRLFAATMLLGVAVLAALYLVEIRLIWINGNVGDIWSVLYWSSFVFSDWPLFTWSWLATAFFLAVLLFHRALGYRLCREPSLDNGMPMPSPSPQFD